MAPPSPPPGLEDVDMRRKEQFNSLVESALQKVHSRLSRPGRASPEELRRLCDDKQRRAQEKRASQDDRRMEQLQRAERRMLAARERRQEREETKRRELLEKMNRARRQYQDQLRLICERARRENQKTADVAHIAKEAAKEEKELLRKKHADAAARREQLRQRQLDSASRLANASERRRKQLETKREMLQQEIEEKERLASQRRSDHINSIKAKSQGQESRSDKAHSKRREIRQQDDRESQDFLLFRTKSIGRLALSCDDLPVAIREEVVEHSQGTTPSFAGKTRSGRPLPRTRTPPPAFPESPRSPPPTPIDADELLSEGPASRLPSKDAAELAAESGREVRRSRRRPSAKARAPPARRSAVAATSSASCAGPSGVELRSPTRPRPSPRDSEARAEGAGAVELDEEAQRNADEEAWPERLRACRRTLDDAALDDEEALRQAAEAAAAPSAGAPVSATHRARISKLAVDLSKAFGIGASNPAAPDLQSLNLERSEAALAELCRAMEQAEQEDVDLLFVLELDCSRPVVDLCLGIKDSVWELSGSGDRVRQLSNLLLSALKWLGLLCKQQAARAFLLMSGRSAALADAAEACLDAHLSSAAGSQLPEASSPTVLFLPQVLHVLSLSAGEVAATAADGLQQRLSSYLAACGLPRKIRALFRLAEARGSRAFDGPSPVPLLLLRSMTLLETIVSSLRPPPRQEGDESHARVLKELRDTELFGVPSVLVSILLSAGARDRMTQTAIALSLQGVRILNHIARFHLATLQEALGSHSQPELYHLLVCIFEYGSSRLHIVKDRATQQAQPSPDEIELLHETISLLGYYCLQRPKNQGIMCFGASQTLLALITSLPLHYFIDVRGRGVLFPTILAACFQSERNLELLRNEMSLGLLEDFLTAHIEQAKEGRPHSATSRALAERFPRASWQEALSFFREQDGGD